MAVGRRLSSIGDVMSSKSSDYYESYWDQSAWSPSETALPRAVADVIGKAIPPQSSCLDVGCGDGRRYGLWLDRRVQHYQGVDVSGTAVAAARASGLNAAQISDAGELPFEDETFDAVVCFEVLEHLFAPQTAVAELVRVLRPGGTMLVSVPNAAFWHFRFEIGVRGRFHPYGDPLSLEQPWRDPHIRFFTAKSLADLMRLQRLSSVRVGGHLDDRSVLSLVPPRALAGRLARRAEPGPIYTRLVELRPSLFALRLHAVCLK
jgi:methionine biosynthesis protein MetW